MINVLIGARGDLSSIFTPEQQHYAFVPPVDIRQLCKILQVNVREVADEKAALDRSGLTINVVGGRDERNKRCNIAYQLGLLVLPVASPSSIINQWAADLLIPRVHLRPLIASFSAADLARIFCVPTDKIIAQIRNL